MTDGLQSLHYLNKNVSSILFERRRDIYVTSGVVREGSHEKNSGAHGAQRHLSKVGKLLKDVAES